MKRVSLSNRTRRPRGERRRLLREYFLNAVTLALMKEAGSLATVATVATVAPVPPRRPVRSSASA
ncbi:MAG: hypothetical protein ACKV19_22635 [Verrucomicrobiales bacterium]